MLTFFHLFVHTVRIQKSIRNWGRTTIRRSENILYERWNEYKKNIFFHWKSFVYTYIWWKSGRVGFLNIAFDVIYILLLFVVTTVCIYVRMLRWFFFLYTRIQIFFLLFSYQHGKKGKVEWFRNRLSCKIGGVVFFSFFLLYIFFLYLFE